MSSYPRYTRTDDLINVHENSALTRPYQPNGTTHLHLVSDLQEQLKSYRSEMAKKDDLIAELATKSPRLDNPHSTRLLRDPLATDTSVHWRNRGVTSNENMHADLAALRIKKENLIAQNNELQSRLNLKDNYLKELKSKSEIQRENLARQEAIIQSLESRIHSAVHQSETLEEFSTRGSATIHTLQKDNRDLNQRVIDLEARVRTHLLEKEESEQLAESNGKSFTDAVAQIGDALNIDTEAGKLDGAVDLLVEKSKTLCQDNLLLESKLKTLEDALNAYDLESKASRETIMRLVAEVGKEQKNVSENSNNLNRLKAERDEAVQSKESLEREVELLNDRLGANEKTWTSSREETTQLATKNNLLSQDVKRLEYERTMARNEMETFKSTMAKLLSGPYIHVEEREDSIKDRIKELVASEQEKKAHIDMLEDKLSNSTSMLERQCELHQETVRRAKKSEESTFHHDSRLKDLENELASGEVLRDTLRSEKHRYQRFLQQMAEAMKMDEVAADLGYDYNTDILITRAQQLMKLEADALVEKTSSNYNLHRKLKLMKEQLKSKELHAELLRKKISQMEERDQTRSALAIDRDDAIVTVQKLQHKVERLKHALGDERVKVTQLKAQLAETNQLKTITLEQRNKIDDLVSRVNSLSNTKDRQRNKLTSLKQNIRMTESNADEQGSRLRTQLDAITGDLSSTKIAFDETMKREKQLVDFREVVARMLGLDVTTLAIPDYEIISRLEKLIHNHHVGAAATMSLNKSLDAVDPRFRAGFEQPYGHTRMSRSDEYAKSYSPRRHQEDEYGRSRSPSPRRSRHHHHHRSRSPSPKRY